MMFSFSPNVMQFLETNKLKSIDRFYSKPHKTNVINNIIDKKDGENEVLDTSLLNKEVFNTNDSENISVNTSEQLNPYSFEQIKINNRERNKQLNNIVNQVFANYDDQKKEILNQLFNPINVKINNEK